MSAVRNSLSSGRPNRIGISCYPPKGRLHPLYKYLDPAWECARMLRHEFQIARSSIRNSRRGDLRTGSARNSFLIIYIYRAKGYAKTCLILRTFRDSWSMQVGMKLASIDFSFFYWVVRKVISLFHTRVSLVVYPTNFWVVLLPYIFWELAFRGLFIRKIRSILHGFSVCDNKDAKGVFFAYQKNTNWRSFVDFLDFTTHSLRRAVLIIVERISYINFINSNSLRKSFARSFVLLINVADIQRIFTRAVLKSRFYNLTRSHM